jgi:hypothetical protein
MKGGAKPVNAVPASLYPLRHRRRPGAGRSGCTHRVSG